MAYVAGNPILSDKEFDELKLKLKTKGSMIVVEGPRCSLRSRKLYSDLTVDYFKMFLLNVPAAVAALGLFQSLSASFSHGFRDDNGSDLERIMLNSTPTRQEVRG